MTSSTFYVLKYVFYTSKNRAILSVNGVLNNATETLIFSVLFKIL
jgi:hypothetical protein